MIAPVAFGTGTAGEERTEEVTAACPAPAGWLRPATGATVPVLRGVVVDVPVAVETFTVEEPGEMVAVEFVMWGAFRPSRAAGRGPRIATSGHRASISTAIYRALLEAVRNHPSAPAPGLPDRTSPPAC
jgi:hypothetical protein